MKTPILLVVALAVHLSLVHSIGLCDDSATEKLIAAETLELMRGRDTNAFAVYSTIRKAWSSHRFPDYLTVKPATLGEFGSNASDAVVAFQFSDGPVLQLVAVDTKGRFRSFDLDKPIRKELRPMLNGNSIIYYIADGVIYAFSGRTGTWDTLKAPNVPEVRWENGTGTPPSIAKHGFDTESTDGIIVTLPQGTATFSPNRGAWKIELAADHISKATADEPNVGPETSKDSLGDG